MMVFRRAQRRRPERGPRPANRFQDFFEEDTYIVLKNRLYNYLLRKRAIERGLRGEHPDRILEVGSGISPTITDADRIVYLDLSPLALQTLQRFHDRGWRVAAECERLPFADGTFTHVICAEVLEHVEDDRAAVKEAARVLAPSGSLLVNFPHRKFYYAADDRFVRHYRRYEIPEMVQRLTDVGLKPVWIRKVLGPLDKVTMCFAVYCFDVVRRVSPARKKRSRPSRFLNLSACLFTWANRLHAVLVWLDARVVPRALATQLLMKAVKQ